MKYLFLGGSHDGEWMDVDEELPVVMARTHQNRAAMDPVPMKQLFEETIYRKLRLADPNSFYEVFCDENSLLSPISKLIKGYRAE